MRRSAGALTRIAAWSFLLLPGGCMWFAGTIDAWVPVHGHLATDRSDCLIRFNSPRLGKTRGQAPVPAGDFRTGLVYHAGEQASDFHAELSCGGGPWRQAGPEDVFQGPSPINLGRLSW